MSSFCSYSPKKLYFTVTISIKFIVRFNFRIIYKDQLFLIKIGLMALEMRRTLSLIFTLEALSSGITTLKIYFPKLPSQEK